MGTLFIVSGPSGAGKTSLLQTVLPELKNTALSISCTTRPPRSKEKDGIDYHFIDKNTFAQMTQCNDFLESAEIFGYHYGTSRTFVDNQRREGKNVILEIDFQGARQIREKISNTTILILPPSLEILYARLKQRGQDSDVVIKNRLAQAQLEISHCKIFDFVIHNSIFDTACTQLKRILCGEKPDEDSMREARAALNVFIQSQQ